MCIDKTNTVIWRCHSTPSSNGKCVFGAPIPAYKLLDYFKAWSPTFYKWNNKSISRAAHPLNFMFLLKSRVHNSLGILITFMINSNLTLNPRRYGLDIAGDIVLYANLKVTEADDTTVVRDKHGVLYSEDIHFEDRIE